MAQLSNDIRIDPLRAALLELGHQRRVIFWLTRLVRAGWVWWSSLLCVLLLDAAVALPPEARIIAAIALLVGIPLGLWTTRTRRADERRGPLRDARSLESHHELPHNPLVNGLFLAPLAHRDDPSLASTLAGRTRDRAEGVVQRIDRQVVIDRRALRRQFVCAAAVAGTWLFTLLVAPGILSTGLARMLLPFDDVPPFSFTRIELAADPAEPFVGDDVALAATVSGDEARRVELVELDEDFNAIHRYPMAPAPQGATPGAFVRTLRSVTRPMLVQAEANGARSQRLRIVPKQKPPEASDAEAEKKSPAPDAAPDAAPRQPRPMKPQQPGETLDLAGDFPELYEKIQQLQAQARGIGEMTEALGAMDPASPEHGAQLDAIEAELAQMRARAAEAAAMARAAAKRPGLTDKQRAMLEDLAAALESLGMCKLGSCPNPGAGLGGGSGIGGGGLAGDPLSNWINGLETAQASDFAFINRMLSDMGFASSPFGDAGPRDAQATSLPGDPDPAVGGDYAEAYDPAADAALAAQRAMMQRVPPAYRDLVRRYYERLAEDERNQP